MKKELPPIDPNDGNIRRALLDAAGYIYARLTMPPPNGRREPADEEDLEAFEDWAREDAAEQAVLLLLEVDIAIADHNDGLEAEREEEHAAAARRAARRALGKPEDMPRASELEYIKQLLDDYGLKPTQTLKTLIETLKEDDENDDPTTTPATGEEKL